MTVPTRFPKGLSTSGPNTLLGNLPFPNPFYNGSYFDDFFTYAAGDWATVTTNSGTIALQALNGGSLLLTTGATATNDCSAMLTPASFSITPGFPAWFVTNVTITDVTTTASPSMIIGMTKGGPNAPTDGIYFTKAGGITTSLSAVIRASSTSTTITGAATIAANTPLTIGWYYDGGAPANLYFFSSSAQSAASAFGQPNAFGGLVIKSASNDGYNSNPLTNLPASTAVLQPEMQLITPTSVVETAAFDFIGCSVGINRS